MTTAKFGLLGALFICVLIVGCTQKTANAVIIVNADGVSVKGGTVEFVKDGRRMRANFWAPGNIVIYRVDATTGGGDKALAGKAYVINGQYRIDQIASVDVSKSDEQLCQQFGVMPEKK
jgi:hypothetical protein